MMRTPKSCLILGSGMGGLALGALLARAGVDVTILEAHPELIGGWAQTLRFGDYKFSAGPRYLWNFGPGQIGRRFLDKCGLTERVPMVELDRRGFDHIYVGDAEPVRVPRGWAEYEEVLKEQFPAEADGLRRFFALCRRSFHLTEVMEEQGLYLEQWPAVLWKSLRRHPLATEWIVRHKNLTLHQAFERCGLGPGARAVLEGHGLIFLEPARSLSFHVYAGATLLYHRGSHYPVEDMEGFVKAVAGAIETRGGRILRGQRVVAVRAGRGGVEVVTTAAGERFRADAVVVNYDPATFLALVGGTGARPRRVPKYRYSGTGSSLFLGVKDARLLEPAFGRWNLWYHSGADLGPEGYDADPLEEPRRLYLNSATLVKGVANDAPPGGAAVAAFAACSYRAFHDAGPALRQTLRVKQTAAMLDLIERRFAPGLRDAVEMIHLQTPDEKEGQMHAPRGNVYARSLDPGDVWTKFPFRGVLPNLYFVGAYVSFGGIATVIHGACRVYRELTGDRV